MEFVVTDWFILQVAPATRKWPHYRQAGKQNKTNTEQIPEELEETEAAISCEDIIAISKIKKVLGDDYESDLENEKFSSELQWSVHLFDLKRHER